MDSNELRKLAFLAFVLICFHGITKGSDRRFSADNARLSSNRPKNRDIKCSCSCCGQTKNPVKVCVIDIIIALDRSSFHAYDKEDMTVFLASLLTEFESKYQFGPLNVRIGIIVFSTNATTEIRLNEYRENGLSESYLWKLIRTVEDVQFVGQASNMHAALILASQMFRYDIRPVGQVRQAFGECYHLGIVVPKVVIILSNAKIEPDGRTEQILRNYKSQSIQVLPVRVSKICNNPPCGNEEILKMLADTNRKKQIFNMEMQQRTITDITTCIMETCTSNCIPDNPLCNQCNCTCETIQCQQERNCKCGIKGLRGPNGTAGPPGRTGNRGSKGSPGVGRKGSKGLPGPEGDDGVKGRSCVCQGNKGRKGDCGEDGDDIEYNMAKGNRGPKGHKGTKGRQGDRGDRGLKGSIGFQGPPGIPGPRGNDGYMSEVQVYRIVVEMLQQFPSCDCCDASGSVSDIEFSLAKDWITKIVKKLTDDHVVSLLADVLAFSSNTTWPIWRETVTKSSYLVFETKVKTIPHVDQESVMASAFSMLQRRFKNDPSYDKILVTVADFAAYYESLYFNVAYLMKKFDASSPILIDNFTRQRNSTAVNRLIKNPSGSFTEPVRFLNYHSLINPRNVTVLAQQIARLCQKSFLLRAEAATTG